MRLGINLGMFPPYMYPGAPEFTLADIVQAARDAETLGVEMICMPEAPVYREAIVPLAAMAVATERIQLATAVLPIGYRSPLITARTIAQLDELSRGRAVLGLGIGVRRILAHQGISTEKPVEQLREYGELVRRLLAGEALTHEGAFWQFHGATLGFAPFRRAIPLFYGSTGIRSLELAGEMGDGVFLPALCVDQVLDRALDSLRAGARKGGRDFSAFVVGNFHVTSVHASEAVARASARHLLAYYIASPHYDWVLEQTGCLERARALREALARGGPDAAARHVTDDLVDRFAVWGTPERCRARLEEHTRRGIQLHVLLPVGPSPQVAMRQLLELVRALRA
jgi:5,10-methylenetetrahydromethanopterin reductase